eukprot:g18251.t1
MDHRAHDRQLPLLTQRDVFDACTHGGRKWIIVDNTVLDVASLIEDKDGAHKGGNVFSLGRDNTHLFHELHANLPVMKSAHRPELASITAHIQEKVRNCAVGVLSRDDATTEGSSGPPLTDPRHRFWQPSAKKPPFVERTRTAIGDPALAARLVREATQDLSAVERRAFFAVVGLLVADAAAQPTHWNYKITYFHNLLKAQNRFERPEFLIPTQNQYYEVPCGNNSCFGDQAWVVLESLCRGTGTCKRVDTGDLLKAHVEKFGPQRKLRTRKRNANCGEGGLLGDEPQPSSGAVEKDFDYDYYGPLGNTNVQSAGDLPIRGPWRHGSLDRFLRNVLSSGKGYPECGSNDGSSDCFIRIVPVVARFAGVREKFLSCEDSRFLGGELSLESEVEKVVRLTQNNSLTVAYACAAARILEQIILHGCRGGEAVQRVCAAAEAQAASMGRSTTSTASAMQQLRGSVSSSSEAPELQKEKSSKQQKSTTSPLLAKLVRKSSASAPSASSHNGAASRLNAEIAEQMTELTEELSSYPYLDGVKMFSGGQCT